MVQKAVKLSAMQASITESRDRSAGIKAFRKWQKYFRFCWLFRSAREIHEAFTSLVVFDLVKMVAMENLRAILPLVYAIPSFVLSAALIVVLLSRFRTRFYMIYALGLTVVSEQIPVPS